MKKLLSIVLVALMLVAIALPAFAANEDDGSITINGISITINGADAASVYEIYRLLDLESYNVQSGAYSYKVNADWAGFFATDEALEHVAIDNAGYVTWIGADDDDTKAEFAKLALAYAEANGIDPVKSSETAGDFSITGTTGKFNDLPLGWYLVDSNVGALCGLTTTNPHASINAKNGAPTIDKQVQEDSTEQWADQNTADVGQTVKFRVTINVHAGAQNYVLHDVMSAGLTFKGVTGVERIVPGSTATAPVVEGTDYTVFAEAAYTPDNADDVTADGCTLEVRFAKDFCDKLETNDKLIVYYEAMLNRNAIVAENGNDNTAHLDYGEGHHTTNDVTKTYTFGFDIVKTDSQNTLIDGAEFKIYDAATGGNEVAVVLMDDGVTYRRARADETGIPIIVKNGQVRVVGFDNGTYYLEETVAPDGYNKLTARQKFIISDGNLDAVYNDGIFSTGSGVHVVNKTGSMLPETGGMGTYIFAIAGAVIMIGTGVVLFSRKRMSQFED